jgi:hypothetical protein
LDYGEQNVSWVAEEIEGKFDGWKASIKDGLSPKNIPDKVKNTTAGSKSQSQVEKTSQDRINAAQVKANWTKYHLTHGGALKGGTILGKHHMQEFADRVLTFCRCRR